MPFLNIGSDYRVLLYWIKEIIFAISTWKNKYNYFKLLKLSRFIVIVSITTSNITIYPRPRISFLNFPYQTIKLFEVFQCRIHVVRRRKCRCFFETAQPQFRSGKFPFHVRLTLQQVVKYTIYLFYLFIYLFHDYDHKK